MVALAHDEEIGVTADIYVADKAYDDTDLHCRLWEQGKHSAPRLKDRRTAPITLAENTG